MSLENDLFTSNLRKLNKVDDEKEKLTDNLANTLLSTLLLGFMDKKDAYLKSVKFI